MRLFLYRKYLVLRTQYSTVLLAIAAANSLLLLVLTIGCDRGPAMGQVQGEVTLDGKPLNEGRVLFTPLDGQTQPAGETIQGGKFTVAVPVAKMKVQINANKVIGKVRVYEEDPKSPMRDEVVELIPHRYNVTSDLTLDVKEGEQSVKYELKSK